MLKLTHKFVNISCEVTPYVLKNSHTVKASPYGSDGCRKIEGKKEEEEAPYGCPLFLLTLFFGLYEYAIFV